MQIKTSYNPNLPGLWQSLFSSEEEGEVILTTLSKFSFKNTVMMKLRKVIGQCKNFTHGNYTRDFAEVRIFSSRSVKLWTISLFYKDAHNF